MIFSVCGKKYLNKLPSKFQDKLEFLKSKLAPKTKRAYLVGGCVRDLILGQNIVDIDLEIYDFNEEEFEIFAKDLNAIGVGKKFFIYKWEEFDLCLPRQEKKIGFGHKAFEVKIEKDEKIASKRRDFTINAIMINIFDGKILDFWGGLEDIKNKKVSIIDEKSFKEDSLRVLRAMQFCTRFGFKIDENSMAIMKRIDLFDLSLERIFLEFEKMFLGKYLHFGLFYLFELLIFEKIIGTCGVYINTYVNINNNEGQKSSNNESKNSNESKIEKRNIFLKCSMEMQKNINNFDNNIRRYYFIYILSEYLKINPIEICQKIGTPNFYKNFYKKQPQIKFSNISDKLLFKVAIDIPICEFIQNYKNNIIQRAKKFGIWDKKYNGGVRAEDVIGDGFRLEEIKIELRKRILKTIP